MDYSDDEELAVREAIQEVYDVSEYVDDTLVVNEYKEDNDPDEVVKKVVITGQSASLHTRALLRTKVPNFGEMVISFDFYVVKFNVFTQIESVEMKRAFFSIVESTPYKQYSILVPIFFIYAYCSTKKIVFPRSLKKRVAIESYTKNNCRELMYDLVEKFTILLNGKYEINYNWSYYVRGFMMMIRNSAYTLGVDSGIRKITDSDNNFLMNEYDNESELNRLCKAVNIESYRLLAVGLIKHNCFNSSEMEHIFDLHVKTLLSILRNKQILPEQIIRDLEDRFAECPPNKKLEPLYMLEEEINDNSIVSEISALSMFDPKNNNDYVDDVSDVVEVDCLKKFETVE